MGASTTVQGRFRYRNDDGTEAGASWKELVDVQWVPVTADFLTPFRLRLEISTSGMDESAGTYEIYLSVNDATYAPITTTSTDGVKSVESVYSSPPVDNSATTEQMAGSGTFVEGQFDTTGATSSITITNGGDCEIEYCLQLDEDVLVGTEKLEFQVYRNGGALDGYTVTPTIASAPTPPVSTADSSSAYIKGEDTTSDNQASYVKGGLAASDSKSAYMLGTICPVIDIQSSAGSIKTCYAVNSYARIIANATSKSAIETLIKFTFDNTTAKSTFRTFIRGSSDWDSNVTPTQAYELAIPNDGGYQVNRITTGSRTAIGGAGSRTADTGDWWLRFRAEGTQIKVKVWTGAEPAAWDKDIDDSGSGFSTAGVFQLAMETTTGGVEHTVTLDDISYHGPEVSDSSSAYISGTSAGTPASDRQPAYIAGGVQASDASSAYVAGRLAASDASSAYIAGTQVASDASSAYIAGTADTSDSQSAYIDALDYFPFTEDFSEGSTGDPWRIAYWATDTV